MFQNENGDIGYDREITSNNIQRAFYIIHARGLFKKIENYMGLSYLAYRAMGRAVPCRAVPRMGRAGPGCHITSIYGGRIMAHVMISSPPNQKGGD